MMEMHLSVSALILNKSIQENPSMAEKWGRREECEAAYEEVCKGAYVSRVFQVVVAQKPGADL